MIHHARPASAAAFLAACALLAAPARAQVHPPEGFVALFNGKDLSGWRGRGHLRPPASSSP